MAQHCCAPTAWSIDHRRIIKKSLKQTILVNSHDDVFVQWVSPIQFILSLNLQANLRWIKHYLREITLNYQQLTVLMITLKMNITYCS